jgi:hypothetical protein
MYIICIYDSVRKSFNTYHNRDEIKKGEGIVIIIVYHDRTDTQDTYWWIYADLGNRRVCKFFVRKICNYIRHCEFCCCARNIYRDGKEDYIVKKSYNYDIMNFHLISVIFARTTVSGGQIAEGTLHNLMKRKEKILASETINGGYLV